MTLYSHSPILFISTYPPRKCGIASFTDDLISSISKELGNNRTVSVCALDKKNTTLSYSHPVTMRMDSHSLQSSLETASRINADDSVKLLFIEHEFGLFGGDYGEYLLDFLSLSEKPYIIRFHTVLPEPSAKRLKIVQELSANAEKIIVMTEHASSILQEDYNISNNRIMVIPHGTHLHSTISPLELKKKYDLENRLVLTNFGLLSPNKGIEKGIEAMKEISKAIPEAIFLVMGQTHPSLIEQEGEKYRDYLDSLIHENGLEDHVRLVNEYIPTDTLMEYLTLTDIYLFTSKDPHQAMSGTFLYAMSAGCPIISNKFVLATEMLDEQTGIILTTNQVSELADHAIRLLKDEPLRRRMGRSAFLRTRNTTWRKVAANHIALFETILNKRKIPASLPSSSLIGIKR